MLEYLGRERETLLFSWIYYTYVPKYLAYGGAQVDGL